MAVELFRPFIEAKISAKIDARKKVKLEGADPNLISSLLREITRYCPVLYCPVLLNRAPWKELIRCKCKPTLHKLSVSQRCIS